jgi:hypothetical protein
MRLSILGALALLCAPALHSQNASYYTAKAETVAQVNGVSVSAPASKAAITICALANGSCTSAAIYADQALTQQLGQPLSPDALGYFGFWAPTGTYQYTSCLALGCDTHILPTGGAGSIGSAATVSIGTVTTLAAGQTAYVSNSGSSTSAVFNFGIPQGASGSGGGGCYSSGTCTSAHIAQFSPTSGVVQDTPLTIASDGAGGTNLLIPSAIRGWFQQTADAQAIYDAQGDAGLIASQNQYLAGLYAGRALLSTYDGSRGYSTASTLNIFSKFLRNGQNSTFSTFTDCASRGDCFSGDQTIVSGGGSGAASAEGTRAGKIIVTENTTLASATTPTNYSQGSTAIAISGDQTSLPNLSGVGPQQRTVQAADFGQGRDLINVSASTANTVAAYSGDTGDALPAVTFGTALTGTSHLAISSTPIAFATGSVLPGATTITLASAPNSKYTANGSLFHAGMVCIANPNTSGALFDSFEIATITATSSTTLALSGLTHVRPAGFVLAQDGTCGFGGEQTADTAGDGGLIQVYELMGNWDSTHSFYANYNYAVYGRSQIGSNYVTYWNATNNGTRIHPLAKILSNDGSGNLTLSPNAVTLTAGQQLVATSALYGQYHGMAISVQPQTPSQYNSSVLDLYCGGWCGRNPASYQVSLNGITDAALAIPGSSPAATFTPPRTAILESGAWQSLFEIQELPKAAGILHITDSAGSLGQYTLADDPDGSYIYHMHGASAPGTYGVHGSFTSSGGLSTSYYNQTVPGAMTVIDPSGGNQAIGYTIAGGGGDIFRITDTPGTWAANWTVNPIPTSLTQGSIAYQSMNAMPQCFVVYPASVAGAPPVAPLKCGLTVNADNTVSTSAFKTGASANTDLAGQLALTGGTASYTFSKTYATAPVCTAADTSAISAVRVQTTTTTLTVTGASGDGANYICVGRT